MEITQFTYFQQIGGLDARPVSVEITYGLERIAMFIQEKDNVFDVIWVDDITYGDIFYQFEVEHSYYNFEESDPKTLFMLFDSYERIAARLLAKDLVLPAYDYILKCSHTFNLLDARGAISVTERTAYIGRVRVLARQCAHAYVAKREQLGFPLLPRKEAAV